MKTIRIPDGFISLAESKAECPYCKHHFSFDELEEKWGKTKNHTIRVKCTCKKFIGIAVNYMGDFVAFELENKNQIKPNYKLNNR